MVGNELIDEPGDTAASCIHYFVDAESKLSISMDYKRASLKDWKRIEDAARELLKRSRSVGSKQPEGKDMGGLNDRDLRVLGSYAREESRAAVELCPPAPWRRWKIDNQPDSAATRALFPVEA